MERSKSVISTNVDRGSMVVEDGGNECWVGAVLAGVVQGQVARVQSAVNGSREAFRKVLSMHY